MQMQKIDEPLVVESKTGRKIVILGGEYVPLKLVQLVGIIADLKDPKTNQLLNHDVEGVTFRADAMPINAKGETQYGVYSPESRVVSINVPMHWIKAEEYVSNDAGHEYMTAYRVHIWTNLILSVLHEFFHSAQLTQRLLHKTPRLALRWHKNDEVEANKFQYEAIYELAGRVDLEMPELSDWPCAGHIMAKEESFNALDTKWAGVQTICLTEGYTFYEEGVNQLKTMDEYLRMCARHSELDVGAGEKEYPDPVLLQLFSSAEMAAEAGKLIADEVQKSAVKQAQDEVERLKKISEELQQAFINETKAEMVELFGMDEKSITMDILDKYLIKTTDMTLERHLISKGVVAEGDVENDAAAPVPTTPAPPAPPATTVPAPPPTVAEIHQEESFGDPPEFDEPSQNAYVNDAPQAPAPPIEGSRPFNHAGVQQQSAEKEANFEGHYTAALAAKAVVAPHSLTPDQCWPAFFSVIQRIILHVSTKCGFVAGNWTAPGSVLAGVPIADIPGANVLFHSMATRKDSGAMTDYNTQINDTIQGDISDKGVPIYRLEVLGADGKLHTRTLIAQNPKTGSRPAQQAKEGWRIFYLIDGDKHKDDPSKWMGQFRINSTVEQPTIGTIEFIDKRKLS